MNVLSFGEILFDVIEGVVYLGGAPLNFSIHQRRVGLDVFLISKIGRDEYGQKVLDAFSTYNLSDSLLQIDDSLKTGEATVSLSEDKVPTFTIHRPCAWDAIEITQSINDALEKDYAIFYFGSLAQREEKTRNTLKYILERIHSEEIFFDINIRKNDYTKEILQYSMEKATIFKLNEDEFALIKKLFYKGQSVDEKGMLKMIAKDFSIKTICLTKGEKGAVCLRSGEYAEVGTPETTVVDTTGAGDAFSAEFCLRHIKGESLSVCLKEAVNFASYVAGFEGAIVPLG